MEKDQYRKDLDTPYKDREYEEPFMEETAAELGGDVRNERYIEQKRTDRSQDRSNQNGREGIGYGRLGLILSVLSFFFLPVIFSIAGIVLGFIARRKGARSVGTWAIGVGIVSLLIAMFILPFF
ncbi:DUF4190 domain-containing protein [Priestia filamentosa]|uniref:DUF4190 domain-containing protein n=1 Tax=Priestia filamentosa TaxID=1402861 RepID=UPI0005894FB2|nr:DUF4190 domain-containing protein [Priestia filamentosa]MDT3764429.1 DUF4190 domain-containing protein [Priestia filamentosa]OXS71114.1 hypothetical protein B1B01_02020 [Priestia filamentosa]RJS66749.1 hypothetical protein CJ485_19370 [Priestia filamentosa]WCM15046.1 DUF4190 domain-containing protein [Priestia filamentosa]WRU94785.1 DUF4190 domain-containing protein [Priestia filamentosa]